MLEIFYHPIYTSGIAKTSNFPRDRYQLIFESISKSNHNKNIEFKIPKKISIEHLYKVHQKKYVDQFLNGSLPQAKQRKIGLRPWNSKIIDRTLLIMGGSVNAVASSLKNGASANLAGGTHHAYYDYGSGYCIFNDLVISAYYCKEKFKEYQNILILDLDVHQGDGTASMVKDDKSIFTFSMHCESNFPLKKQISDLDIPLKKGMEDETYLKILGSSLEKLEENEIDIIFFQAGVDGLIYDALGHLNLSHKGMIKRNEMVFDFCKKQGCPVVIFMGGGYSKPISHTVNAFSELFFQGSNLFNKT